MDCVAWAVALHREYCGVITQEMKKPNELICFRYPGIVHTSTYIWHLQKNHFPKTHPRLQVVETREPLESSVSLSITR